MNAMDSNFKNAYLNNQVFRVVLIPASGKNANVKYDDYKSVVEYYKIDESKIKTL